MVVLSLDLDQIVMKLYGEVATQRTWTSWRHSFSVEKLISKLILQGVLRVRVSTWSH